MFREAQHFSSPTGKILFLLYETQNRTAPSQIEFPGKAAGCCFASYVILSDNKQHVYVSPKDCLLPQIFSHIIDDSLSFRVSEKFSASTINERKLIV